MQWWQICLVIITSTCAGIMVILFLLAFLVMLMFLRAYVRTLAEEAEKQ